MGNLKEVLKEKESTLKDKMNQLGVIIHTLQQQLNGLYTAFTGDYVSKEIAQI